MLALEFGRLLMECGASARIVEQAVGTVARGLGAERVDLRIGYASLAVTVGIGGEGITRMRKIGPLGVNQRLDQALHELISAVGRGELTAIAARSQLAGLAQNPPRHPGVVVDLAVGIACASFGRLLGVDWPALGPVFLASALGQECRHRFAARQVNVFIGTAIVALIASALSGMGAFLLGSSTVSIAMVASVLLLVPGVPLLNALFDILEGRPTLGSARVVWGGVALVFLAVGLWAGEILLGESHLAGAGQAAGVAATQGIAHVLHQTLFGGLAAMGFGVLFNERGRALILCGAAGGLALAVRTAALDARWTLESASFAAAFAVGSGVQLFQKRIGVPRNTLHVAGCIPMVPGGFAAKAILGLIALTQPEIQHADQTLMSSVQNTLRVLFTIGAIGTGLAIPAMLRVTRDK